MNTSDTPTPTPKSATTKRGRKPKTGLQQLLVEAQKNLSRAQERHEKALVRVELERRAELSRTGRQIYLATIEQLHVGERALVVDPVLAILPEDDRSAVQAWMDSLPSN